MARIEKYIVRSDVTTRTWRERFGDAWRSYWLGPWTSKDKALAGLFGSGPAASSGEQVNERRALTVSTFWACATMIAADCASLPLFLYRTTGDSGRRKYIEHPLFRLLHDSPNSLMTSMQFRECLMLSALVNGNGYAEIVRDGDGRPAALWPLAPSAVTPFFDDARQLRYRVPAIGGGEVLFTQRDVLHLRGASPDGIVGYNLVELAREQLGILLASERYAGRYFANYAQLGGTLTTSQPLTELARKNLTEALAARHSGADRSHKLLLLEHGLTYTATSTNPRDGQLIESREHEVREICRYFRVPPAMVGDLSRATWSNYQESQAQYFSQALRGWLVRLEQELDRALIAPSERNSQHFEHSLTGFLRARDAERASYYTAMVNNGIMSINECRNLENLGAIAGGDTVRVPLNTAPLDAGRSRSAASFADALLEEEVS